MASPKFGVSSLGVPIIIDEGIPPGSGADWMRVLFLILTGLMSLIVSSLVYSHYGKVLSSSSKSSSRRSSSSRSRNSSSSSGLPFVLLLAFILSNTFRTLHLLDHMYRPVYYHEPKWVYTKYIFTTVEVPLYIDVIIQLLALSGMKSLINDLATGSGKMTSNSFLRLIVYSWMSSVSFIHYTVEPPSNYGIDANFTIAGTLFTAIGFAILVIYGLWALGNPESESSSTGGDRSDEAKLLGKTGVRTRSMNKTSPEPRRRSRTPRRDNE